jgi:hypothetical protein
MLRAVFGPLLVCAAACTTAAPPGAAPPSTSEPRIDVETPAPLGDDDWSNAVRTWIANARRAVEGYFGRFPVDAVRLRVTTNSSPGIGSGSTRAIDVPTIEIAVHPQTTADQFASDWTLTHEMIHLAVPSLAPEHHWFEEGCATYVEPLARARAGLVTEDAVWSELIADYDQGLPAAGDRGLDLDSSWGRTYYGGAIFCLLADIEIRRLTENEKSLQDALEACVARGWNIARQQTIEDILKVGDAATGTDVLSELYARMKSAPYPQKLDVTWRRLGVRVVGGRVIYDDNAPLWAVRRELILGTH